MRSFTLSLAAADIVAQFLGDTSELRLDDGASAFVRAGDVRTAAAAAGEPSWRIDADGSLAGTGRVLRRQYLGASHRAVIEVGSGAQAQQLIADAPSAFESDWVSFRAAADAVHRFEAVR